MITTTYPITDSSQTQGSVSSKEGSLGERSIEILTAQQGKVRRSNDCDCKCGWLAKTVGCLAATGFIIGVIVIAASGRSF